VSRTSVIKLSSGRHTAVSSGRDRIRVYSTCLYCSAQLDPNDVIEHQSTGRRLAFDIAQGRLWVVCTLCARWNLVPFEQRLEAIDDCERHFRLARARFSTEHIGLARINERLELIRIGPALRPEFAAWRYGRLLRRKRALSAHRAEAVQGGIAGRIDSIAASFARLLTLPMWDSAVKPQQALASHRTILDPWTDRLVAVPVAAMVHAAMVVDHERKWYLELPYRTDLDFMLGTDPLQLLSIRDHPTAGLFRGDAIFPTLGRTLPVFERSRPTTDHVNEAIRLLELTWGDPTRLLSYVAGKPIRFTTGRTFPLREVAPEIRLALEMSAHEDTEQRALHGELKLLEREWREAERVAKIVDGLALAPDPEHVTRDA
jgi:hypothetical protein